MDTNVNIGNQKAKDHKCKNLKNTKETLCQSRQPPPLLYHAIKAHSVPLSFFLSFFLSLIDAALNARTPLKTNLNFL